LIIFAIMFNYLIKYSIINLNFSKKYPVEVSSIFIRRVDVSIQRINYCTAASRVCSFFNAAWGVRRRPHTENCFRSSLLRAVPILNP